MISVARKPTAPRGQVVVAVLILALLAVTAAVGDDRLDRASEALAAGDYTAALELADAVLKDEDNARAHLIKGAAATELGQLSKAQTHLEIARELAPDLPDLEYRFGLLEQVRADEAATKGKPQKATKRYLQAAYYYRKELRRSPRHAGALDNLALALSEAGETVEAIEVLEQWIELDPSNQQARLRLASLLSQEGRVEEARTTIEDKPTPEVTERSADAAYAMARSLYAEGSYDEAHALLEQLRDDPAAEPWHVKALEALDHLQRRQPFDAADALVAFIGMNPPDQDLRTVGVTYVAIHRELLAVLREDPDALDGRTLPKPTLRVSATYPSDARRLNVEGEVNLLVEVGDDGRPGTVDILSIDVSHNPSFHSDEFRQAAMDAVKQWEFEPANIDGEPVGYWFPITINFTPATKRSGGS